MTLIQLRFVETVRAPFPVTTNGAGTGLAVCVRLNDPYLAFVTQVPGADTIHYLRLPDLSRHGTAQIPQPWMAVSGLGYDPISRRLLMASGTFTSAALAQDDRIAVFDPDTSTVTDVIDAVKPQSTTLSATVNLAPQGMASNGLLMARASEVGATNHMESRIELFTRAGLPLGGRSYPGRRIRGLSPAPWSWIFADVAAHELVVVGPFGTEIAVAPGPGPGGNPLDASQPRGLGSVAFDQVNRRGMASEPQVWLPGGVLGQPGTINHPDTPWSPAPYGGRHKIYVANETDQTIYGGYLTAA